MLRRERVHATFFEIGQEVTGRAATLRRFLGEGDEIGNHTMHHGSFPGSETLAALPSIIETLRARGFRFATVNQLLGQRTIYKPYG